VLFESLFSNISSSSVSLISANLSISISLWTVQQTQYHSDDCFKSHDQFQPIGKLHRRTHGTSGNSKSYCQLIVNSGCNRSAEAKKPNKWSIILSTGFLLNKQGNTFYLGKMRYIQCISYITETGNLLFIYNLFLDAIVSIFKQFIHFTYC
jgi:hypothetical protein